MARMRRELTIPFRSLFPVLCLFSNMRWLWIDRFLEFHRGKSARALKNLSLAEDIFATIFRAIRSCRPR